MILTDRTTAELVKVSISDGVFLMEVVASGTPIDDPVVLDAVTDLHYKLFIDDGAFNWEETEDDVGATLIEPDLQTNVVWVLQVVDNVFEYAAMPGVGRTRASLISRENDQDSRVSREFDGNSTLDNSEDKESLVSQQAEGGSALGQSIEKESRVGE